MLNEKQHTNVWFPAMMTLINHGILIALLLYFVIETPIPPYPAGGGPGMEVNLGFSEEGMGDIQPEKFNPNPNPNTNKQQTSNKNQATSNEKILTQNYEDAASIKTNTKENKKPVVNNNTNQPQINEPSVNPLALFKANSGGSEGETGNPGDQGNPNGDPNAKNHYGNPGTSDRPGDGGNLYNLGGRNIKGSLPKPTFPGNEQGKVVVEIFVDRNGIVTKANAGVKGSTLLSKNYLDASYNAAIRAKFDSNPNAPEVQKGSITYKFTLQ